MNERQFELYRLSVGEQMPNSPYKAAVINAINHKLMMLDQEDADSSDMVGTANQSSSSRVRGSDSPPK